MDHPVRRVHTCVFGSSYHRVEVPGKLLARQVRADVDDDVVVQLEYRVSKDTRQLFFVIKEMYSRILNDGLSNNRCSGISPASP